VILIDDRIGSSHLGDHLRPGILHSLTRLEYADCMWAGNGPTGSTLVGVELKTLSDLLSSMQSGRLMGHQLIGMAQEFPYRYLVVEGSWRTDQDTGTLETWRPGGWRPFTLGNRRFTGRELEAFLVAVGAVAGTHVIQTRGRAHTGEWVSTCYSWWQKEWKRHQTTSAWKTISEEGAPKNAFLVRPNIVMRVAKEIDGVGWDRARKLGERYSSVLELALATEDELMTVDGIGKKVAAEIRKAMTMVG